MLGKKGSTTVFMTIMLAVMIAFTGIFIDLARIRLAQSLISKSLYTAMEAMLSMSDNSLLERYGLLALDETQRSDEALINAYGILADMIGESSYGDFDPFGLHIESMAMTSSDSLDNPLVIHGQIRDLMQYRAPVELALGFLDSIRSIIHVKDRVEGMGVKLQLDRALDRVYTGMGKMEIYETTIVAFEREQIETNRLLSRVESLSYLACKRMLRLQQAQEFEKTYDQALFALDAWIELLVVIDQEIPSEHAIENSFSALERFYHARSRMEDAMHGFLQPSQLRIFQQTVPTAPLSSILAYQLNFQAAAESALKSLYACASKADEAFSLKKQSLIEDLMGLERSMAAGGNTIVVLREDAKEARDLAAAARALFHGDDAYEHPMLAPADERLLNSLCETRLDAIGTTLDDNIRKTRQLVQSVLQIESAECVEAYSNGSPCENGSCRGLWVDAVREAAAGLRFEPFGFLIERGARVTQNMPDPRPALSESIHHNTQNGEDTNIRIGGTLGDDAPIVQNLPSIMSTQQNQMQVEPWFDHMQFCEQDTSASEGLSQTMSMIDSLEDWLHGGIRAMYDKMLLNEYILLVLKNRVTSDHAVYDARNDSAHPMPARNYMDLRGRLLADRPSYFDKAEVEYVIAGHMSETANMNAVYARMIAIRFAMNLLSAKMDKTKVALARTIAMAVVGWTVAGVPIVTTLILCAWAMAESVVDMKKLLRGEAIPFFKQEFYLDITENSMRQKLCSLIEQGVQQSLQTVWHIAYENLKSMVITQVSHALDEYIFGSVNGFKNGGNADSSWSHMVENPSLRRLQDKMTALVIDRVHNFYPLDSDMMQFWCEVEKTEYKKTIMDSVEYMWDETSPDGLYAVLSPHIDAWFEQMAEKSASLAWELFDSSSMPHEWPGKSTASTPSYGRMNYNDYLRILLILTDTNTICLRLADIIQLNLIDDSPGFLMRERDTGLTTHVEIALPYLFGTSFWIHDRHKTEDKKRHVLTVAKKMGYG